MSVLPILMLRSALLRWVLCKFEENLRYYQRAQTEVGLRDRKRYLHGMAERRMKQNIAWVKEQLCDRA